MKYILLPLLLIGCVTPKKCVDKIQIIKCAINIKEKIICYKTIRCVK